jgi:hypothetical protein
MSKRDKIIYWIATAWLSLGMVSTGIVQIIGNSGQMEPYVKLGYPLYFIHMLGISKLLGVIVVLLPKFPRLKEWAYAGFLFMMLGALYSHLTMGSPASDLFGPSLLVVLTGTSWYFRPADRKMAVA